ncbi:MAG: ribose 5-phosphate isomerase A [Candidatus Hodarchaeales archaeon]|jgi:ribose 5-phosphate isomerase A
MDEKTIEQAKKIAAELAVEENIQKNMILGIGSGSTIIHAVRRIKAMDSKITSSIICIPTSYQSKQLLIENRLKLGSLDQYSEIDVAIDGADEIDDELNLIKGGGGCLVQEKIVASNSRSFIVIADWRKKSSQLGEKWRTGIPVEIIPQAHKPILKKLKDLGGVPILRMAVSKMGPVVTDNGNFIIDVDFGKISNPSKLYTELKMVTGVVDSGLFVNMTTKAYIGQSNGKVQSLIP